MRYTELTLENFRVFNGTQTILFPEGNGVVVVYGKNGKGKTSLLNAIRWAWTGTARRRGNRVVEPGRLVNSEAVESAAGQQVVTRVRLIFEESGVRWDLTRLLTLERGRVTTDVTLLKDGVSLTSADTTKTLAELMPPEIEQFFLFDGEMLDQYEKLVDDEGPAGSPLRDAIERILGVPVVVNAARDMRALADDAGKAIADAAKRETRTRELGIALEQGQLLRTGHRNNRDAEDDRVSKLQAEIRDVEELMADQSNKLDILARRSAKREQLADLNSELAAARNEFATRLADSWRAVLVDPLKRAVSELEETLESDRDSLSRVTAATLLKSIYDERDDGCCPACGMVLDADHEEHLAKMIQPAESGTVHRLTEIVQDKAQRVKTLRRVVDEQARADLRVAEEKYRRLELDIDDVEQELRELDEALRDAPTDELLELAKRETTLSVRLNMARRIWEEENSAFLDVSLQIERLRNQIAGIGTGSADTATVRREQLLSSLATLLEEAVVAYRDKLREDVQETASKLFRDMRSETDFIKLVINDHYGLRILDRRGNTVEDRSAGYEHLVALSLVGALQACSSVSAPVVMDSPFGRLDPEHVEAVVGQLNVLADQVLLLVHEGELDRATAHRQLRGRLLAEFELQRVSGYNTLIREVRAS